jgi:hypothetical protein
VYSLEHAGNELVEMVSNHTMNQRLLPTSKGYAQYQAMIVCTRDVVTIMMQGSPAHSTYVTYRLEVVCQQYLRNRTICDVPEGLSKTNSHTKAVWE